MGGGYLAPRIFLARHGETEWTLNGRHTGVSEIPLTPHGETQVVSSSAALVGKHRLIDPAKLTHVYVSPRVRARRTYSLFLPDETRAEFEAEGKVTITEALSEWGYGRYEGMFPAQIREDRKQRGLDKERPFDIWRDGCEDREDGLKGEGPNEVKNRIDGLIEEIKEVHRKGLEQRASDVDILLVGHGHLLRAFAKRWMGWELETPVHMILEPGGVGVLTYNHNNIDEPAFVLGPVFRSPDAEEGYVQ
ncbi:hypothetical protein RUND412_008866 [Rhizina undulata]